MKVLRVLVGSLAAYTVGWTLAYLTIMGSDLRYFWHYLFLAWTGQAGELPGYMHLTALLSTCAFALVVAVAYFMKRKKAMNPG
jgi:hypothetical protein